MEEYLRIGVITSPHGVKGEVNVYPTTDQAERFSQVNPVILTTGKSREEKNITSVKFFKNMVILKLTGVDNMDQAEGIRNGELWIHRSQSPLKPGEHLIADILDLDVVLEDGEKIGVLEDVLETGANHVFLVRKTDGRELLLPDIPSCILNIDEEAGRITVNVLPGLED